MILAQPAYIKIADIITYLYIYNTEIQNLKIMYVIRRHTRITPTYTLRITYLHPTHTPNAYAQIIYTCAPVLSYTCAPVLLYT